MKKPFYIAFIAAFLAVCLLPTAALLCGYEAENRLFERLAMLEEGKSLPWSAVWDMFCLRNGVSVGEEYITEIQRYEREVTSKR